MAGMSDILMLALVGGGMFLFYKKCIVDKECGGIGDGDIDDTGGIIDPIPDTGGGGTTCSKGYKKCTDAANIGKCCCNRVVKGCGSNQVAALSGGNCICKNCASGYHRGTSSALDNRCLKNATPTPAPTYCPGGSSSTNCSWDCKGAYCWKCLPPNCGVPHTKVCVNGPSPSTASGRNTGCNLARNQFIKVNTPSCKSCCTCRGGACKNLTGATCTSCCNVGQPTCIKAAKGNGCASGYCCGNDGNCNWAANTNFGGYKSWSGRCSGSFGGISSGCCGYAVAQLKKKYGMSAYTQVSSFATIRQRQIQRQGRLPMGRRRAIVGRMPGVMVA